MALPSPAPPRRLGWAICFCFFAFLIMPSLVNTGYFRLHIVYVLISLEGCCCFLLVRLFAH